MKQFKNIVFLTFILFTLSACMSEASDKKEIKIGYQKVTDALMLKESEAFHEELSELGYEVTWAEFNTGSSIIEALHSGSIDFANSGDMPALFALAKGMDFQIFASQNDAPETEGIVARKDSGIKKVADLKGKRVAYNRASIAEYLTLKALEQADLSVSDIEPVHLDPSDANIALEKGEVDAWVVWDPYMTSAESKGNEIIQTAEGLAVNGGYQLASQSIMESDPAVAELITKHLNLIADELNENATNGAALMEDVTSVDAHIWEKAIKRKEWGDHDIDRKSVV